VERGSGPPTPKTEVKQIRAQYEKKMMTGQYCAIRSGAKKAVAELSEEELNRERVWTMKSLQCTYYDKEIEALKKGHPAPRTSALAQYTPTLDSEGLLRVGSRQLGADKLSMGACAPLIVPPTVAKMANERPISYVNSNPADIQAVRPSHFFMFQFRAKTLHARRVWRREREELKVGDVVAVLDAQAARGSYPLGCVVSLRRSRADDRARACKIRIGNKVLARPVTQLIPLCSAVGKDC